MNQKASNHTDPLGLAALGIVFGDIGTSPLYTLKTVLSMTVGTPTPAIVLGVLSLIVWTLIIITSVKYVIFAMSIDNDGEGGILALMSLLGTDGLHYLLSNGFASFLILGGVFLCVTGAEALYADMGHFGSRPIRFTWSIIVFPSLLLNYAGQSAIVLEGTPTTDNIFYRLCPELLLIPFVILATIATIIASQSIITGAFSMTRQGYTAWLAAAYVDRTDV